MLRPKPKPPPLAAPPPILRSNLPLSPPPPPPTLSTNGRPSPIMSPALVAARKATGSSTTPPPPTPPLQPLLAPSVPSTRGWSDPSSFPLPLPKRRSGNRTPKRVAVDDRRWKFKREDDLPGPRISQGTKKVYKSGGKGSSVPLDLRTLG